jgi:hypothetical protein
MTGSRFFLGLLIALGGLLPATDARTFTSADGRTIEAEVVEFDGTEKVTIKRADTGQTFTLPISSFAEEDRAALLKEAEAEAAKPPRPGAIVVELGRKSKNGTTSTIPVMTGYTNGTMRRTGEVKTTEANASYTLTIINRSKRDFTGLRVDYVLFAKKERDTPFQNDPITSKTGSAPIKLLASHSRTSIDTVTIPVRKTDLDGTATWSNASNYVPVTLKGVWLRIYKDDVLWFEHANPDSLAKENTWPDNKFAATSPSP